MGGGAPRSGLIPAAVAESLRYEPSVGSAGRVAREAIDLDGIVVPAGSMILLSALRDEAAFKDPDTFDIRRADLPRLHPIFGGGAHRCIGGPWPGSSWRRGSAP